MTNLLSPSARAELVCALPIIYITNRCSRCLSRASVPYLFITIFFNLQDISFLALGLLMQLNQHPIVLMLVLQDIYESPNVLTHHIRVYQTIHHFHTIQPSMLDRFTTNLREVQTCGLYVYIQHLHAVIHCMLPYFKVSYQNCIIFLISRLLGFIVCTNLSLNTLSKCSIYCKED